MKKEINANGHKYVDLGLPSGTLWATCNVGATKPEEYGLYFQWGDTVGYTGENAKKHSTWQTVPFNWGMHKYNPDFESLTNLICPKGILQPKYDAAHVHMGGDWRMPTKEQFEELKEYTVQKWERPTFDYGHRILSSKSDKSKYIIIPDSGFFFNNNYFIAYGSTRLWCSNLSETGFVTAYRPLYRLKDCFMGKNSRCYGFCVRGVIG